MYQPTELGATVVIAAAPATSSFVQQRFPRRPSGRVSGIGFRASSFVAGHWEGVCNSEPVLKEKRNAISIFVSI
jgi:hypothetical protein